MNTEPDVDDDPHPGSRPPTAPAPWPRWLELATRVAPIVGALAAVAGVICR
jgi:hypothetical protein